jgi:hypothetical protein
VVNKVICIQTVLSPGPDVAFACFNVSWEDMVFGRQCHVFLTGLILDSIRLEDSKDCTLKITNLVYFLWVIRLDVWGQFPGHTD